MINRALVSRPSSLGNTADGLPVQKCQSCPFGLAAALRRASSKCHKFATGEFHHSPTPAVNVEKFACFARSPVDRFSHSGGRYRALASTRENCYIDICSLLLRCHCISLPVRMLRCGCHLLAGLMSITRAYALSYWFT